MPACDKWVAAASGLADGGCKIARPALRAAHAGLLAGAFPQIRGPHDAALSSYRRLADRPPVRALRARGRAGAGRGAPVGSRAPGRHRAPGGGGCGAGSRGRLRCADGVRSHDPPPVQRHGGVRGAVGADPRQPRRRAGRERMDACASPRRRGGQRASGAERAGNGVPRARFRRAAGAAHPAPDRGRRDRVVRPRGHGAGAGACRPRPRQRPGRARRGHRLAQPDRRRPRRCPCRCPCPARVRCCCATATSRWIRTCAAA